MRKLGCAVSMLGRMSVNKVTVNENEDLFNIADTFLACADYEPVGLVANLVTLKETKECIYKECYSTGHNTVFTKFRAR